MLSRDNRELTNIVLTDQSLVRVGKYTKGLQFACETKIISSADWERNDPVYRTSRIVDQDLTQRNAIPIGRSGPVLG